MTEVFRLLPLLITAIGAPGCAGFTLGGGPAGPNVQAPRVSVAEVRLARMPSNEELASYYCSRYLGPTVCRAFGPAPALADIVFSFDVELELTNPSSIPLPVLQSLFAFTAFPEQGSGASLGTVCLSFCEDSARCEQDADACVADDPEIRDARDFAQATAGFLYSVAVGERRFDDLGVRIVPPNGRTRMVVRLGIDPARMTDLIATAAKGEVDRIKRGELPTLAIPYRIEGTTWVAVESFGRLAAEFGPSSGQWRL